MAALTARQQEVLDFISRYIAEKGYPPSRSDMAKAFSVTVNAIQEVLQGLVRRGAITVDAGISRGIRII